MGGNTKTFSSWANGQGDANIINTNTDFHVIWSPYKAKNQDNKKGN